MQTPEPFPPEEPAPPRGGAASRFFGAQTRPGAGFWALGTRIGRVAALVLALSSFMSWYSGSESDLTIAVIGWHVGLLGKLVFFVALAVLALDALREAGIELPATLPESLIVIALGSLATVFVLIRLIDVPDEFFPYTGRGIGIWVSLASAVAVIAAGLLQATEEL